MTHKLARTLLTIMMLALSAAVGFAQNPGVPMPDGINQGSDQIPGSILIYPLYSSTAAAGNSNNTRINVTNTSSTSGAIVHFFLIDGSTCGVADSYICLTANQTASFLASDVDPGTTGYMLAIATNQFGVPIQFNHLIGDEYVKLTSGHFGSVGAYAIRALNAAPVRATGPSVPIPAINRTAAQRAVILTDAVFNPIYNHNVPNSGGSLVRIEFDGLDYGRLPFVVANSNIPSAGDGNDTRAIFNSIGGNYATGAAAVGNIFGLFYDDAENVLSYNINRAGCQVSGSYSDSFPRLVPRFTTFIPAGRSGWTKFWSTSTTEVGLSFFGFPPDSDGGLRYAQNRSIVGIALNRNPNATTAANAYQGAHNFHTLTLNNFVIASIPVFPPACDPN